MIFKVLLCYFTCIVSYLMQMSEMCFFSLLLLKNNVFNVIKKTWPVWKIMVYTHWAHTLVSQSEEVIATNSCLSSLGPQDFFLLPSPPASDGLLSLMSPLSPEINCLPAEQVTTTSDVIIFTAIDHTFGEKSQ